MVLGQPLLQEESEEEEEEEEDEGGGQEGTKTAGIFQQDHSTSIHPKP